MRQKKGGLVLILIFFFVFNTVEAEEAVIECQIDSECFEKICIIGKCTEPTATFIFVPVNWKSSMSDFDEKVDERMEFFLDATPLSECKEAVKVVKGQENCKIVKTSTRADLWQVKRCGKKASENYDRIIGLTDDESMYGEKGGFTAIDSDVTIATTKEVLNVAHELGHTFGLKDEYCNFKSRIFGVMCGYEAEPNPLKPELGCYKGGDSEDRPPCCTECKGSGLFGLYPPKEPCCDGNIGRSEKFLPHTVYKDENGEPFIPQGVKRNIMAGAVGDPTEFSKVAYEHLETFEELSCTKEVVAKETDSIIEGIKNKIWKDSKEKEEPFVELKGYQNKEVDENVSYINSIGMNFMYIPAGEFDMGYNGPYGSAEWQSQFHVILTKPFYIGKYEVTQKEWKSVMDYNPSYYENCDECPVESLTVEEVDEFIKKLNLMEVTCKYRLPTQAEWEYAARAGTATTFSFGDDIDVGTEYAWCCQDNTTHPVGRKKQNPWGLYDVHGNVKELVQDFTFWYPKGGTNVTDYIGTDTPRGIGTETDTSACRRIVKGGSALSSNWEELYSGRYQIKFDTERMPDDVGFRVAIDANDITNESSYCFRRMNSSIEYENALYSNCRNLYKGCMAESVDIERLSGGWDKKILKKYEISKISEIDSCVALKKDCSDKEYFLLSWSDIDETNFCNMLVEIEEGSELEYTPLQDYKEMYPGECEGFESTEHYEPYIPPPSRPPSTYLYQYF